MKEKLRIGVIGAGSFCRWHLDGINNSEHSEAVVVCDLDIEKAKLRAKQYGVAEYCSDYKEILAREDIDAVTLPLPDQEHCKIACDALRAGKHVLCEKPMALDLDECKEMVRVARETGKQLMVGQIGRYTPAFIKAKELLESGAIGDLFFIESEYAHDYSRIPGSTYGDNTIPWRKTAEREPILGGGCHAIDLIRMIAGDPVEVFAYANNKSLVDWPIHDTCVGIMKFDNGVIGKVFNSHGCKREYTMRSLLYGTKGTIIFDNTHDTITLYKEDMIEGMDTRTLAVTIPVELNNHNFAAEVEDFSSAILEGRSVVTDGVSGAKTVSVGTAIIKSFTTGEKVTVDYDI